MIEAAFWGGLGASALLIGAILAFLVDIPRRIQGLILAFGAGTLIGAVAYELVAEALAESMQGLDVAAGFAAGAVVFFLGSVGIDRMSASSSGRMGSRRDRRTSGYALVLGAVLDGIPESVVLGLSLVGGQGIGVPVLVAVFISNLPEGLSAAENLAEAGLRRRRILGLWVVVLIASATAAAFGFGVLGTMGPGVVVLMNSFAAGAIMAMLAESAIPEAYEEGGRAVGLATALGFAIAAALSLRA